MHTSRSLVTICIITACIITSLSVWGVYGWMVIQTSASVEAVAQLASDRDTALAKIAYSESLRTLLRDTAADRTQLAQLGSLSAVDLVDRVHTLSSDAGVGVTIESIAPGIFDPSIAVAAPALTLTISAKGTFTRLHHLIRLLETISLPIIIDQLALEHQKESTSAPWSLRARLLIYTENAK